MISRIPLLASLEPSTIGLSCLVAFLVYYIGWIVYARFFHPFHDIPGPFLASITSWHRSQAYRFSGRHDRVRPQHSKYGIFVRVAPDEVQIADPTAIDVLQRGDFLKSEFYDAFDPKIDGRVEPFAERRHNVHAKYRKIITPLFRPELIDTYEPNIDRVIEVFCSKIDSLIGTKFDLARLTNLLTWDMTGDLVYNHRGGFGLLRDETDYLGWPEMIKIMPKCVSAQSYAPYGFQTLYFLSQVLISSSTRYGLLSAIRVIKQVKTLVKKRRDEEESGDTSSRQDLLSKMMRMSNDEKIDFTDGDIVILLNAFVWAGADTTGSGLGMMMGEIVKHKQVYRKLQAEIDTAMQDETIRYQDAAKLPYLSACVKESLRVNNPVNIGLVRYVPPGGAHICGRYFPAGYKVGVNLNVIHRDKKIFGDDADVFRPERWMEADESTLKRMNKYTHSFGFGTRVCLGESIALHQIYKFIPTVLRRYQFEYISGPDVYSSFFTQPEKLMVEVKRR